MSTESVLAAMFSSPTLNVIVLAMAFALFPLPVVGLKLATVALLILVIAPLAAGLRFAPAPLRARFQSLKNRPGRTRFAPRPSRTQKVSGTSSRSAFR